MGIEGTHVLFRYTVLETGQIGGHFLRISLRHSYVCEHSFEVLNIEVKVALFDLHVFVNADDPAASGTFAELLLYRGLDVIADPLLGREITSELGFGFSILIDSFHTAGDEPNRVAGHVQLLGHACVSLAAVENSGQQQGSSKRQRRTS